MTKAGWKVALACSQGHGFQGEGLDHWYPMRMFFRNGNGNGHGRPAHAGMPVESGAWWSSPNLDEAIKRIARPIKPWVPFPDKSWWFFRLKGLEEWARRISPDLIYSSSPPPAMHLIAGRLAKRLGVPWVAEMRDLWSDNFFEHKRGVMRHLDRRLEQATLGRVNGMVTVSQPLADALRSRYHLPVEVIYSSFNGAGLESPAPAPSRSLPLRILYAGRVYPGTMMPDILLEAVQRLLDSGVVEPGDIQVDFFCHNHQYLRRWRSRNFPGLSGCCRVLTPIDHQDMVPMQRGYHALLHIGWFDHNYKGCVTSKFFEYLGAGRPILSTAKPGSVTEAILDRTGAGATVHTPEQCAEVLLGWVKKLRMGTPPALGDHVSQKVSVFSCGEQTAKLSRFLMGFLP